MSGELVGEEALEVLPLLVRPSLELEGLRSRLMSGEAALPLRLLRESPPPEGDG